MASWSLFMRLAGRLGERNPLAIIACLLIHLWTGGRPTLRSYEMICFYLSGWADLDELTAHLEKLVNVKKNKLMAAAAVVLTPTPPPFTLRRPPPVRTPFPTPE